MFTRGPTQLDWARIGAGILRAPGRRLGAHFPGERGRVSRWLGTAGVLVAGVGCLQVLGDVELVADAPDQVILGEFPATCADAGGNPCPSPGCLPGSFRCDGDLLESCDVSGADWRVIRQCASAGLCSASAGSCQPPACDALQYDCTEAGDLVLCNADRTGFDLVSQCGAKAFCNSVRGQEGCEPAVCSAGARRCNAAQLEECRPDQMGYSPVLPACLSAALCRQDGPGRAHCEPPTCAPGDYSCEGRQLRRCSEDRSAWLVVDRCLSAPLCDAATKACAPPTCQLGEQRCTGSVLERCNSDQNGFAPVVDCGNPLLCDRRVMACLTMPAATPAPPASN